MKKREVRNLNAAAFAAMLQEDTADRILVDSRDWEEFRERHIRGALFIPLTCSISDIAEAYIEPGGQVCLIADEHGLEFMIGNLAFGGVENIESFVTPEVLRNYFDSGGEADSVHEIEMFELDDSMQATDPQLIDLRRPEELEELGWVGDAINIPHLQLRDRIAEIESGKDVHLYCRSGQRSKYATSFLMSRGHSVIHLAGGILQWLDMGKSVKRSAPR